MIAGVDQAQETASLPTLTDRERRRATVAAPAPDPGRYLAVENGDEVVLIRLTGAVTRIGRGVSVDVNLDDSSVSRRHALVVERRGQIVLLDDRSMNGTWRNGERVTEAVLRDGDVIALGAVRMRFLDVPA